METAANAAFRGAKLRALVMVMACGGSLAACASTTPEMAARGVRPMRSVQPATATRASYDLQPPSEAAVAGGRYKLGAPYQVAGLWYVPAEEPDYDEVGVASWYGDEFDGKATANGETFDKYAASAAHATLPMPSIVEVTNLDNGRTIRVRLNDRGPYKAGRLIDLSRGAAEELGYMDKGTAKVRVRYIGPAKLDGTLEPLFIAASNKVNIVPTVRQGPITETPIMPPQAPVLPDAPRAPSAWAQAPTASKTVQGEGGFAVQAGAYSDRARAEKVAETLSSAGAAAIRPIEVASRQLYRVVVGPWSDETQATAARAHVASLGFADARVIKAF